MTKKNISLLYSQSDTELDFVYDETTGKIYNKNNALYSSAYNEFNIIFQDNYDRMINLKQLYKDKTFAKNVSIDNEYGG